MILTTQVRLLPTQEQVVLLRSTLERCNKACSWISKQAIQAKTFHKVAIQKLLYGQIRHQFDLGAQATVRCIAKVADAHKVGRRSKPRRFRRFASQPFDARLLSWKGDYVSIWTLNGRIKVPIKLNEHQKTLLKNRKGEVDLCLTKSGKWLLLVSYELQEQPEQRENEFVGVDLGIVNLATDSDGVTYSGDDVEQARRRYSHRRRNLQRKRTRSAKRKLKKISGKEARFRRDVNHQISKAIVEKAQYTDKGIALEDLKGIRKRIKARRKQRSRLHSWSFHQQRLFIAYKAKIVGVEVVYVNPAYTSQTCSQCGFCSKENRPTRDKFICGNCCFYASADHNAALNISFKARAAVNQPNGTLPGPKVAKTSSLATSSIL